MLKYLTTWSNLPIPTNENFDYYINLFDRYYNSKQLLKILQEDITQFTTVDLLKKHTAALIETVITDIKSKPRFSEFLSKKKHKSPTFGKFYTEKNNLKIFISIDIRTANFTLMRNFDPTFFDDKPTWPEYLSKYTTSNFIKQSKPIREFIFGKLQINFESICSETMSHIFTELSTLSSLKTLSLTHRSHDEIIYETTEPPPYELKSYLEKNYPNMFHIKTFQLLQLGKKPFYVKEYSTGTTEFKCTPKKFLCQAIRYYQKDPPGTLDLKFTDEQQTATYDHPLNFDS